MSKPNLYDRTSQALSDIDKRLTKGTPEYADAIQALVALNLAFIGDRLLALEGFGMLSARR